MWLHIHTIIFSIALSEAFAIIRFHAALGAPRSLPEWVSTLSRLSNPETARVAVKRVTDSDLRSSESFGKPGSSRSFRRSGSSYADNADTGADANANADSNANANANAHASTNANSNSNSSVNSSQISENGNNYLNTGNISENGNGCINTGNISGDENGCINQNGNGNTGNISQSGNSNNTIGIDHGNGGNGGNGGNFGNGGNGGNGGNDGNGNTGNGNIGNGNTGSGNVGNGGNANANGGTLTSANTFPGTESESSPSKSGAAPSGASNKMILGLGIGLLIILSLLLLTSIYLVWARRNRGQPSTTAKASRLLRSLPCLVSSSKPELEPQTRPDTEALWEKSELEVPLPKAQLRSESHRVRDVGREGHRGKRDSRRVSQKIKTSSSNAQELQGTLKIPALYR